MASSNYVITGLADSLFALLDAREELRNAMANVPSYTGDKRSEWYYENEQARYDEAAANFAAFVHEAGEEATHDFLRRKDMY